MGTHPIFESDFDCLTEMENDSRPLVQIFNSIFENLKKVESDESSVDLENLIKESVSLKNKIKSLGLYSDNEEIDEISTKTLKYFLVSYFEGYFRLKMHDRNPSLDTLKIINRCFLEYLKVL